MPLGVSCALVCSVGAAAQLERISKEARDRERRAEEEEAKAGKKLNKKAKKRMAELEDSRCEGAVAGLVFTWSVGRSVG